MAQHSFDTDHAGIVGIESAIILYNLQFWLKKNKANDKHFYDGRHWTYNSVKAWQELFPYLTKDVIRKRLDDLTARGILLKGFFSTDKRDRTAWYSVDESALHLALGPNAVVPPAECILTDSKHSDSKPFSTVVEEPIPKEEFSGDTVEDLYTTITGKKVMPDRPKRKAAREKKEKRVDEFYQPFVSAWCEAYPDLGFNAISGKKIKDIIRDTKWWMTAAGKEVTPESATNMFKYILDYVKRTPHFAHGKPITTFAGQYLSIIKEIKEGKPAGQQRPASGSIFSKYQ